MTNTELLKSGRDLLLSLHKTLVDFERAVYEGKHGPTTGGQFLNLLLEDVQFSWLRKFSTLIVDIDEMFAQKDGFSEEAVESHLSKIRKIVSMQDEDDDFVTRYQGVLQEEPEAAATQGQLRLLLG